MTLSEHQRYAVSQLAGNCPAACNLRFSGAIYRSAPRSVTLRCSQCGLQWMVTVHQLAKAARRHWDAKSLGEEIATIERWAASVPERRGRKPAAA